MRNICYINLIDVESCGSLITATDTNELLLNIRPLITQLTGYKVEITKSGGGIITSGELQEVGGMITYSVSSDCYSAAGTMRVRLLSNEGNSDYVSFTVSQTIGSGDSVQVRWLSTSGSFSITKVEIDTGYRGYTHVYSSEEMSVEEFAKELIKPGRNFVSFQLYRDSSWGLGTGWAAGWAVVQNHSFDAPNTALIYLRESVDKEVYEGNVRSDGGSVYIDWVTTPWATLTLNDGVSAVGITPKYRKLNGRTCVEGKFGVSGYDGSQLTIGTLPSGFRPRSLRAFVCASGGYRLADVRVLATGAITLNRIQNYAEIYTGNVDFVDLTLSFDPDL